MPTAGSYPDTVDDWEGLLTSARNNADKLPDVSPASRSDPVCGSWPLALAWI